MSVMDPFCMVCQRAVHVGSGDDLVCPVCSSRLVGAESTQARVGRVGGNEAHFREVNEAVEHSAQHSAAYPRGDAIGFVCECGSDDCSVPVYLTVDQYESVRADAARFAIVPGHDIPGTEEIVERYERYDVVEKTGWAAGRGPAGPSSP
ncbi:MAG: hypothetical protein ABR529_10735 [Actinomycetota bacterium]